MLRSLILCLSTILLIGCGTLPKINPDLALRSPKSIQINGAQGALSHAQSKAIIAKLKKGANETNIFDRHLLLQQTIGVTPLVVGNKVELLIDGPPTYTSMFASIEAAKMHINLETYILEPDEIGQHMVDALLSKQKSGVQINIIYDSAGSVGTDKAFFQPLIDAGAHVIEFNPINPLKASNGWQWNNRDHRKLLVVDGEKAYVGGINISSVYTKGSSGSLFSRGAEKSNKINLNQINSQDKSQKSIQYNAAEGFSQQKQFNLKNDVIDEQGAITWRDTHLLIEGPIVADFQHLFLQTWQNQKGAALEEHSYFPQLSNVGTEVMRAIGSTPNDEYSLMYVTLLSAINSAESNIWITNAYFVPDEQLLDALKGAAIRGVDVRLLLPSKSDSNLVFYASHSFYSELLKSGVKIYERQNALLHAKTALIDGVWSSVGSTNLDWRSFLNNQEIDAVVISPSFGAKMRATYEEDLKQSKQIDLENWEKRSLLIRLKERSARLWARFL